MMINPPKVEGNEALFQIAPSLYQHTWEYYYRQYEKVTHYLIHKVYQGLDSTFLSRCFQPIMFLLRHNIELMLKANRVAAIGMNINDESHNLTAQKIDHLPEDFFDGIEKLFPLSDAADEFRYPESTRKKENGYVPVDIFEKFYRPELFNFSVKDLLDYYVRFTQQIGSLKVPPTPLLLPLEPDYLDRKGIFEVYPNDNLGYGLIQTAYDTIIIELCNAIINSELCVDDILLPLLFLLHHSLELGCKRDLEISKKTSRSKSHKLQKLHSKVNKDYDLSIKEYSRPDEQYSPKKISEYMKSFGKMYRDNPLLLRFPKMKNGELLKNGLSLKNDVVLCSITGFCEYSPCLNWAMDFYYRPDEIAKDEENYRKLVESQKPMGEYDDGIDLDDRAFCE